RAYAVGQVRDAVALDDAEGAVELQWRDRQAGEERYAGAEHDRDEVDVHLVEQASLDDLGRDGAAVDADLLGTGERLRTVDGADDAVGDEDEGVVLRLPALRHGVRDDHDGHIHRVPAAPPAGHVEQPTADDQRAGTCGEVPQVAGARGGRPERHLGVGRGRLDVAAAVPLEEVLEAAVGGVRDV